MENPIGPAGSASQAISIPPPQSTTEAQPAANTQAPESGADQEVATTQRVDPDSNVGNNIDTTA